MSKLILQVARGGMGGCFGIILHSYSSATFLFVSVVAAGMRLITPRDGEGPIDGSEKTTWAR